MILKTVSVHPKYANADHDVLDIIRQRWSPRAFDATRDVDDSELWRLFEAARWAASSYNEQPWRFVVASRRRSAAVHRALVESLTGKNPAWAGAAPVLALVAIRTTLERNEAPNQHAWYDTGQAVGFLTLQATSQGLSIRQMEGFDRERARAACQIPAPFDAGVIIAIGYAGDPGSLAIDTHREAETKPRQRKPAAEFVYDGTWGKKL